MLNFQLDGSVAVLTLDDGKANAVGHEFIDALDGGLDRALSDARAVVIAGRPGLFSAGFNLKEIQKGPDAAARLLNRGAAMFLRLYSHPQPLVAACTGHAIAAGAFLLLSCDTRIGATGEYQIGLNETAIGMTFPVFAFELAHARLSKRHLTQAFVQSTMYDPANAVDAGFLDEALDAADVVGRALEEAARLAELPTDTYGANKVAIRQSAIAAIRASIRPETTA